ncbi:aldehyde dehydrogenase family protein [Duganella sp. FT135W]|uniref:Aldehyde dehydrogenase family protein n=1 Tax=Duganella flavida TaxID=2692175 RepID=A0A6L8KKH8_9BURK|nr:aldehyde dehydrogenase family protein [Duganella flavida]MYM26282.1 aldehyde dehydrogenase family protein [Duganella flavida]
MAPTPQQPRVDTRSSDLVVRPFIGGQTVECEGGALRDINPFDGSTYAMVQQGGRSEIVAAIGQAQQAQRAWFALAPKQREIILFQVASSLEERREELVEILINEGGSTVGKANFEVGAAADMVRGAAGECRRIWGETMSSDVEDTLSFTLRRPVGVVAAILPFNFPLLLGSKKIAFALAAGNGVVIKPSPHTPVIGLRMGEIFEAAGLPKGLVNVVPSDAALFADTVLEHPGVAMLSFTGSSAIGRELAAKAGTQLKRVTLELGGKSALVVLADADLEHAVDAACFGILMHQGQICMANSRVIVEQPLYERFVERLTQRFNAVPHGDPRNPANVVGPLIHGAKVDQLKAQLAEACTEGARVACGGKAEGSVFAPTVVADVTSAAKIFDAECFGPIVCVTPAADAAEALALANQSSYGLSSAVITNDLAKAMMFVEGLEAGMVHINESTVHDEPLVPFGGIKGSGLGREGGRHSIEAMTELKWVTMRSTRPHVPF